MRKFLKSWAITAFWIITAFFAIGLLVGLEGSAIYNLVKGNYYLGFLCVIGMALEISFVITFLLEK